MKPTTRIGQKADGSWGVVEASNIAPTVVVEPERPWRPSTEDVPLGPDQYMRTMALLARDDLDVVTVRKVVNRMIGLPPAVRLDLLGMAEWVAVLDVE